MKDLGLARKILGIEIIRNKTKEELFIYQGEYTKKILKKFNMAQAKAASTPLA